MLLRRKSKRWQISDDILAAAYQIYDDCIDLAGVRAQRVKRWGPICARAR